MSDDSGETKRKDKETERSKKKPKKKVADSSSDDSGPDDLAPVRPSKKAKVDEQKPKKTSGQSNVEEEASFLLSKNKFVKVRSYRGQVLIDIREFYLSADGELKPGKKGISINAAQWDQLKAVVADVDAAIKERV